MTTKPQPDANSSTGLSRRAFLRRGSAATVATVGVGAGAHHSGNGPVGDAEAIAPVAIAAGAAAVGGLAYMSGVYTGSKYFGDNRDYSNYTGYDALLEEIKAGTAEMASANEQVLTSIENNITHSENVALAKGKAAIIKEMNNGNGESAANTAMTEAIDKYYASIQKNIFTHYVAQHDQFLHHTEQIGTHEDFSSNLRDYYVVEGANVNTYYDPGAGRITHLDMQGPAYNQEETTITLLDGTEKTYLTHHSTDTNTFQVAISSGHTPGSPISPIQFSYDGSSYRVIDAPRFDSAWSTVLSKRDDVISQLSGFLSDVYAEYEAGEIPTEDIVDPITAATELDAGYDGYQTRGAHAAMMGIPTNAEQTLTLEVENPDTGETVTVSADIYTNHVPTDSNGNEVGFQKGETYDPTTWSEPIYISYAHTKTNQDGEVVEETQDFEKLEVPFTVVEATNKSGETVDSFKPESRSNQTADVSKIEEELAQIREEQIAMQEEAQQQSGGGGFAWDSLSIAGIPGQAVALGGAAAVLLGISNN